ncbi:MAG: hypothetical protein J5955_02860 [Bacilli bacterium]|nr:hypothetical protein [Bacilli bacterium]
MKRTDFIENSQYCIYADYHDLVVRVLYKDDELYTQKYRGKTFCLFLFDEDDIPDELSYKEMRFSKFFELVKNSGYLYFGYYYDEDRGFGFHVDAYKAFTKEALDEFLKICTDEKRKDYDFLFKKWFIPYRLCDDYDTYYQKAIDWIEKKDYITQEDMHFELELKYNQCKAIIENLIEDGLISTTKEYKLGYKVIKNLN